MSVAIASSLLCMAEVTTNFDTYLLLHSLTPQFINFCYKSHGHDGTDVVWPVLYLQYCRTSYVLPLFHILGQCPVLPPLSGWELFSRCYRWPPDQINECNTNVDCGSGRICCTDQCSRRYYYPIIVPTFRPFTFIPRTLRPIDVIPDIPIPDPGPR